MEEISFDKYTKRQAKELHQAALCDEITDERLARIKGALHETSHLAQYNRDSFIYLVKTLLKLPDESLKEIEDGTFRMFYKRLLKNTVGFPQDYNYLTDYIASIFYDYKNIPNLKEYNWLSNCMLETYYIRRINDPVLEKYLAHANYDLNEVLKETIENVDHLYTDNPFDTHEHEVICDRRNILSHILVTYMMYKEEYPDDPKLPVELFNGMVRKMKEKDVANISKYVSEKEEGLTILKQLLDSWYKGDEKIIIIS